MYIEVKVRASSGKSHLYRQPDNTYKAELKAVREKGKANAELIGLVAQEFGVSKNAVRIKSGQSNPKKLIEVIF